MQRLKSSLFTSILMAAWLGASPVSAKDDFRVGGSGDGTVLLTHLLDVYSETNAAAFEVESNIGSRGGIRAVLDGVLDMSVSGRPLNAEEIQSGLEYIGMARTSYVLITSNANPQGLTSADIPTIFAAEKAFWKDGEPIRIILRRRNHSEAGLLRAIFPKIESSFAKARNRSDVPIAATDNDNMQRAVQIPGSLTWISLTRYPEVSSQLKVVEIDGIRPNLQNLESGAYPYVRQFYLVTRAPQTPALKSFIAFVQSPAGAKAMREASALPFSR